jgi:hypothetical protein
VGRRASRRTGACALLAVAFLAVACASTSNSVASDSTVASKDASSPGATSTTIASAKASTTQSVKLAMDSFKGSCDGASVSQAKAYDKAAKTHKAVYFESFKDQLVHYDKELPDDWSVAKDAPSDAFANVDLVVCGIRTGDAFFKKCDGYTDESGKVSGHFVNVHSATYKLTVHDANTGTELGSTQLPGIDPFCPDHYQFSSDATSDEYYMPIDTSKVVAAVKPYAQP